MFKNKRKRNILLQAFTVHGLINGGGGLISGWACIRVGLYPGGLISGIIYSFENGWAYIRGGA